MRKFTTFTLPDRPERDAAFTTFIGSTSGRGQAPGAGGTTQETAIEPTAAEQSPTAVRATAIVPEQEQIAAELPQAMGLSRRKCAALRALAAGESPGAAARAAGVHTGTIFRWRSRDPYFIAALNAWQAESMSAARRTLMVANEQAAKVVLQAVRNGNVQAALAVVRGLGTLSPAEAPEAFAPAIRQELSRQRDRQERSLGIHRRKLKNELREAEESDRLKKLALTQSAEQWKANETAQSASLAARNHAERYARFRNTYCGLPPLPRPITQEQVAVWVKEHAKSVRTYPTRVSATVVAVKDGGAAFAALMIELWEVKEEDVLRCLANLPWLLDLAMPWDEAEVYIGPMEQAGAVLELRPSWVE